MKKLIGVLAIASVFSFVLMGCTPPVEGDTAPPPAGKDAPKTDTTKEIPKTDLQTPTAPTTG